MTKIHLTLASLLALGVLAFTVAPALAAETPEPPQALPPDPLFATQATLHGTLDPGKSGVEGTFEDLTYEFVYRQSATACKGAGEVKTTEALGSGYGHQQVSQEIAGLTPETEYSVCLVVHNKLKTEEAVSPTLTFITRPSKVHTLTISFGSEGSGPGQLREPVGVAVNDETGDVYVVDKGNNRVEYFSAAGVYEGEFNGSGLNLNEGVNKPPTGRFEKPEWIAVDNDKSSSSYGDVYVTDNGHEVVDKFGPQGEYLGQITGGQGGVAFSELEGVAVDAAGTVWIAQHNPNDAVDDYSDAADNAFIASRTLPKTCEGVCTPAAGFAVGPEDDLYLNTNWHSVTVGSGVFTRYNSAGQEVDTPPPPGTLRGSGGGSAENEIAPAVNLTSNELYIDFRTSLASSASRVGAFESASASYTLVEEFGGAAELASASGIAVDSAPTGALANAVYVAEPRGDRVELFRYVVIPDVTSVSASGAVIEESGAVAATLNGTVDPEGEPVTSCVFEYGTTRSYGKTAPCETESPGPIGNGTSAVPVHAKIEGLAPDTTYHFRLRAADANDEADPEVQLAHAGADQSFTTPGPGIEEPGALDVTATSAKLLDEISPHGAPTSFHFEYDTREYAQGEAAHGASVPVPAGALGSGQAAQAVSEEPQDLAPSTRYFFRVVAVSEVEAQGGATKAVTFASGEGSFTTQQSGTEFTLPDGREYELVSPSQKQGALFMGAPFSENYIGDISCKGPCAIQAAAGGDAFTDEAQQPSEREPRGNANRVSVLMVRGASGWSSQVIAPPHSLATGDALGLGGEYARFSTDLSRAVLDQWGDFTPLSLEAVESTPYLRTDYSGGDVNERCEGADLSSGSCFAPLVTRADTQPGVVFGDAFNGECPAIDCGPQVLNGTPDLSHILIGAREQLTEAPVIVGRGQANGLPEPAVYEWYEGALRLVNILPGREVGGGARIAGGLQGDGQRELSSSGARAILEGTSNNTKDGTLYLRDIAKEETLQLNLAEPGCVTCAGGGRYETANVEDTRIFMVAANRLTRNASGGGVIGGQEAGDLYECAIVQENGKDRCDLTDLTPETNGESSVVQSVLGTSEDGSYVYFVAGAKLASGAAPGAHNLYVRHEGVTSFIAQLSAEDLGHFDSSHGNFNVYENLRARVSPNGRWLAFMSDRGLAGYDNRDAVSGRPDEEVYLYHEGANTLSCASCDPSGARPVGVEEEEEDSGRWVAASVPKWSHQNSATANVYQPRYLSDSGRLFFDSKDALVPLDVNGVTDVYEYEPEGVPAGEHACAAASASASDVFKSARSFEVEGVRGEEAAGCVALISSGTSLEQSVFLDASETGGEGPHGEELQEGGGDVFFLTGSRLTSNDLEGGQSIFDAQECTGSVPCPPPAPLVPPPCDTEASCRPSPTPQPSIYGLPSSATFAGPGNINPPPPPPPVKKVTKKTVKCKQHFVKNKKGKCVRVKTKSKSKKSTHHKGSK